MISECLQLKKSNCKNCHKCIRHCPVKSIRFSDNQAQIISNECILCGQCVVNCPQNAKQVRNDVNLVKEMIAEGTPVYVSLAPSFIANYKGAGIDSMAAALKKLGFAEVEETAIGATLVKREYERLIREERQDVLITSCCHSVNLMIQKYYPSLLPYLADVLSPMQAHCADMRRRNPDIKTVFIGPCLSKKDEAAHYPGYVDAVLTFEELTEWMKKEGITPELIADKNEQSRARIFPTTGGVLKTFTEFDPEYSYIPVDGVENCQEILKDLAAGNIHKCVIEMSACAGSCIGGPALDKSARTPVRDYIYVSNYTGKEDFAVEQPDADSFRKPFTAIEKRLHQPTEAEIRLALRKMGKNIPQDELNCGSCGYNSCREKAIAICQGKAEITMCLPYLTQRVESLSDQIVTHNPNGIILINQDLEITMANDAACKIFSLQSPSQMRGNMISDYLDPEPFLDTLETGNNSRISGLFLDNYNKYVSMTVVQNTENMCMFAILEDITASETDRLRKEEVRTQTIATADKVVEKQMRIVQEIAYLLGETTAETKIALTKLKESVADDK